jgi:hypothetical protein
VRHREHVAAGQDVIYRRENLRTEVDHVIEKPCRQPEAVDAFLSDHLPKSVEIGVPVRKHAARAAVEQGSPELEGRGVKRGRRQEQRADLGTEGHIGLACHEADHGAVRHHDTLGAAGRTGRIHHVGRALRGGTGRRGWSGSGSGRHAPPWLVACHEHHPDASPGQTLSPCPLRDHQLHPCVSDHEGQALVGILGWQRRIGTACLENAQHRDDELHRAIQKSANEAAGLNTAHLQVVGQPVGLGIEFSIGQASAVARYGDRCRCPCRLRREAIQERRIEKPFSRACSRWVCGRCEQRVLLTRSGARQPSDRGIGVSRGRGQQRRHAIEDAVGRGCLEQIGSVFQAEFDPLHGPHCKQGHVEV